MATKSDFRAVLTGEPATLCPQVLVWPQPVNPHCDTTGGILVGCGFELNGVNTFNAAWSIGDRGAWEISEGNTRRRVRGRGD
jgi:hypothetical protein